ncbi:MAG TPA: DUF6599 family protein [Candidatus Limnocylindrales bacterium]|jgi:hypothetical protein|nr:DUF6599 family protein [Candidatus Limnocylindrales bacterium]
MIKRFSVVLVMLCSSLLWGTDSSGVLPQSFNGWQIEKGSQKSGDDPAAVDAADSAVLKEYGFAGFESATYVRNGRKMQVKAARFNDATGGYGAFTYYIQPLMRPEKIGDLGASNNRRILFYRGNILVDVTLEQVTAMSAADLRALADALPQIHGNISALPTLPGQLPKQSLISNSQRYIVGPAALDRLGVPLPASLVNFSMGPEVEFATYRTSEGEAKMTVIGYPTPQISAERMKAMQAANLPGGPFFFKRSGPLLAIINGNIPESEAQSLLASVNYDADVTWNQPTKPNPRDNIGGLIVGIFTLVGVILVFALIFGFAFGGARVVAKKLFPNRVFDKPEDVEIIRLDL